MATTKKRAAPADGLPETMEEMHAEYKMGGWYVFVQNLGGSSHVHGPFANRAAAAERRDDMADVQLDSVAPGRARDTRSWKADVDAMRRQFHVLRVRTLTSADGVVKAAAADGALHAPVPAP